jgi:AraC family transcriptional regulator of adaptative response / DNA-3-methyladenine glycosylase II
MFDLDADVRMIHATLRQDPLLAKLVEARPGLRVPGAWDPFELLVRAILGQQITVGAARGLAAKLVGMCGDALEADARTDDVTHVFPCAARVARADLTSLGMPRARAAALAACARAVARDPRFFDPTRPVGETLATLHALPGIGEWTAQYVALRALRDPDAFPATDIGIQRGAAEGNDRPTAAAVLARAEAWRPWRGYAAQYLWSRDAPSRLARGGGRPFGFEVASRNDHGHGVP